MNRIRQEDLDRQHKKEDEAYDEKRRVRESEIAHVWDDLAEIDRRKKRYREDEDRSDVRSDVIWPDYIRLREDLLDVEKVGKAPLWRSTLSWINPYTKAHARYIEELAHEVKMFLCMETDRRLGSGDPASGKIIRSRLESIQRRLVILAADVRRN